MVRAHHAQHAFAPDADVLGPQPEVHLAMPLAVERAGRQDGANLDEQLVVGDAVSRTALPRACGAAIATPVA